jgi:predicted thioesterase
LGGKIHTEVEIDSVEGNKVTLVVSANDGEKQVGGGTHERFVIDKERFLKRIGGESQS